MGLCICVCVCVCVCVLEEAHLTLHQSSGVWLRVCVHAQS